jgi:hypothetical protein
MALTRQSGLDVAGDLAKVHPRLVRLHVAKKSKKRHLLRNAVYVGTTLTALLRRLRIAEKPTKHHRLRNVVFVGSAVAVATSVAFFVCRRRGWCRDAGAADREDTQGGFPERTTPDIAPDGDGTATEGGAPQDIGTPKAA